jgi:hypothetical protein
VFAEPAGEGASLAAGQHVHGLVGAHVDQDGVIRLAAADREVVDAEYLDVPGHGDRLGADEPDQHVTAGRHAEPRREPGPGPPGQRERDPDQCPGQRRGPAGERRGQSRYLLGERRLPAPGASALEPADLRDHQDPPAAERKVGELTLVAGVNPRRAPAAPGARHVARPRPDPERHHVPAQLDAVYDRGSELRQKRINSV